MEGELTKINKLKSVEDWTICKFQVKVLMIANECLTVAEGTEMKPESPEIAPNMQGMAEYQKDLKR